MKNNAEHCSAVQCGSHCTVVHCSGDDKRCNTLQAVSNAARTRTFRDDGYAGYAGNTLGTLGMLGTLRHMTIVALSCFCLRAIAAFTQSFYSLFRCASIS